MMSPSSNKLVTDAERMDGWVNGMLPWQRYECLPRTRLPGVGTKERRAWRS